MPDRRASYAALTAARKTNPLVLYALRRSGIQPDRALDIGAGAFADTRHLLRRGFTVDAVDSDPVSQELSLTVHEGPGRFTAVHSDIRNFTIADDTYSLILALHVLSFLPTGDLAELAAAIVRGLRPDGVLCCSLLGERDSWAGVFATAVREPHIAGLFAGLSPLYQAEREYDGIDAEGNAKHWHVFRQILIKPAGELSRTDPHRTETSGRIGEDYHRQRFW